MAYRQILPGESKTLINNIYSYNRLNKAATERYIALHPDHEHVLKSYFNNINVSPLQAHKLTENMCGVSARTVTNCRKHELYRESMETRLSARGRKSKVLPDWCLGAIRTIISCMLTLIICFNI